MGSNELVNPLYFNSLRADSRGCWIIKGDSNQPRYALANHDFDTPVAGLVPIVRRFYEQIVLAASIDEDELLLDAAADELVANGCGAPNRKFLVVFRVAD